MLDRDPHSRNQYFDELEAYEKTLSDPLVERLVGDVRACNELLMASSLVAEDQTALVIELSSEWHKYISEDFILTGNVLMKKNVRQSENVAYTAAFAEERPAFFLGFEPITLPVYVDGVYFGEQHKITPLFMTPREGLFDESSDEHYVQVYADVDTTTFSAVEISFEKSENVLLHEAPESLNEIDALLYNAGGSEADSLLALKDARWSKLFDMDNIETRDAVAMYLNSKLNCDTSVPYGAQLLGMVRFDIEDHNPEMDGAETGLFFAQNMKVLLQSHYVFFDKLMGPDRGDWTLMLRAESHDQDTAGTVKTFDVPMSSIESLKSLRYDFYDN